MNCYMKKFTLLFTAAIMGLCSLSAEAQKKKTTPPKKAVSRTSTTRVKKAAEPIRVKIVTDSGIIIVKLYDSTPLHRDNFVKLVNEKFYDSLLFHRVIPEFMIQGGDPLSKNAEPGAMLGMGGANLTRIPAEFNKNLIHKKGALAAARDGNPEKASSACQYYIVQGKKYSDEELNMLEQGKGFKYTPAQRAAYKTMGGTPMLDMEYTVFGEVESGLEVIDRIANAPRNRNNRPNGDIRMQMEIIK
jgi:cyclophilin family peptidyl-prolyl cis-trans isomerase